jgi:hypothetical protein
LAASIGASLPPVGAAPAARTPPPSTARVADPTTAAVTRPFLGPAEFGRVERIATSQFLSHDTERSLEILVDRNGGLLGKPVISHVRGSPTYLNVIGDHDE